MDKSIIKEKLFEIFNKIGIYIDNENLDQELELDSLQFAIIIFEIEQALYICIGVDGNIITYNELRSFNDYLCMIQNALNHQNKANL